MRGESGDAHGLYWRDTRLLSGWDVRANGVAWQLPNSAATTHFAAQVILTNRPIPLEHGEVPARALGLVIGRVIGAGGMHEDLDLANHSPDPMRFKLAVNLASDFADIFDVTQGKLVRRGRAETQWQAQPPRLETRAAEATAMQAGDAIYVDACSACHDRGDTDVVRLIPTQRMLPTVQQASAQNFIRVVLQGMQRRQLRRGRAQGASGPRGAVGMSMRVSVRDQ